MEKDFDSKVRLRICHCRAGIFIPISLLSVSRGVTPLLPSMTTVLDSIQKGTAYLQQREVEGARLNMEWLTAKVLDCERMDLYMQFERPLSDTELAELRKLLKRRGEREPLQHLMGTVEFAGREFLCDRRALIPRPETEELVALVKERMEALAIDPKRILDMGVGSGILALSLAFEYPESEVLGVDVSKEALSLAMENRSRLELDEQRVVLRESDLFSTVDGRFDLVVANLPYIGEVEREQLSPEVRADPEQALFGGQEGAEIMFEFLRQLSDYLSPSAVIGMEMGSAQREVLSAAAREAGLQEVQIITDDSQNERFLVAHTS